VHLLIGPDTYAYIAILRLTSGSLVATPASRVRPGAPGFDAMAWFARVLARTPYDQAPRDVIFRHEGKCGRCGRELTHPESIDTGIGPDCAQILGLSWAVRGPSGGRVRSLQQVLAERRAEHAGDEGFDTSRCDPGVHRI
jgi:hypothetical protein